jgi:hypothetical protein
MHQNNMINPNDIGMRMTHESQNRYREFVQHQECENPELNEPFEDKSDLFARNRRRYSPTSYRTLQPESRRIESEDTESSIYHFHRTIPMVHRFCTCLTCATHWYDAHYARHGYMYHPTPSTHSGRVDNYTQLYEPSQGKKFDPQEAAIADDTFLDKEVEMINSRNSIFRKRKHLDSYNEHPLYPPYYQYSFPYHGYYSGYVYHCNPYFHPYGTACYRTMPSKKRKVLASDTRLGSTIYVERSISPTLSDITDCDSMDDSNNRQNADQRSFSCEDISIWRRKSGTKVLQLLIDTDIEEDYNLKAPSPIERNAKGNFFDWDNEERYIRTVSPRSS